MSGGVATVAAGGKRIHSQHSAPAYVFILMSHCRKLVLDRCRKAFPGAKPIIGFYEWDYILNAMDSQAYRRILVEWKWLGVKALVQFDFSVWHHDPPDLRFSAVVRNFSYMRLAQDMGYEVALNFNNIIPELLSEYEAVLPKRLVSVVVDGNHTDGVFMRRESQSLDWLLANYEVGFVLVRTGKRLEKGLEHILKPIRAHRVAFSYSPTEMFFMAHKQEHAQPVGAL